MLKEMRTFGAQNTNQEMDTFYEDTPRDATRSRRERQLLWAVRLLAVAAIAGVCYASYQLWLQVADTHQRTRTAQQQNAMNRDVANLNMADSTSENGQTENVRWVNLFLEDIIITSNRPQQLRVEEAPATTVEKYVSPDDAPRGQGQQMSAGQGDAPPPRHYSHRYTGDDDEADSVGQRPWSFRASLQGFKRYSLLARYQLNDRWAVEGGLSYGSLSTGPSRNSCLAIPLTGYYKLASPGTFDVYALGGGMFEKVCKGGTPMQFLLRGGVDVEYRFSRQFSAFVQPTLRYHIGNDHNIPDLYGRRLGLNIHFGISFRPK